MTVRELIHLLEKEPPEMKVVIRGYEGGTNDVVRVEHNMWYLYKNTAWYYGCHDYAFDDDDNYTEAVEMIEILGGREDGKEYE